MATEYDPAQLAMTNSELLQQLQAAIQEIPEALDRIDYLLDGDRLDVLWALHAAIAALQAEENK